MKNRLENLNDHLFEQLERLNDETLTGEELDEEIKRSRAISSIAGNIINNANVMLNARKHIDEYYGTNNNSNLPDVLKIGNAKDVK